MKAIKALAKAFTKSTYLPLEFKEVGLQNAEEIRRVIDDYAKKKTLTLEYQNPDMPHMHFTLDGIPYTVTRGWGRGGPCVEALRDDSSQG